MNLADDVITIWLTIPLAWAILGTLLLIFEITMDGSKVFFLPLGLAALVTGLILFVQESGWLPAMLSQVTSGHRALLVFAILGLGFAIILRKIMRHYHLDDTPDVNDY